MRKKCVTVDNFIFLFFIFYSFAGFSKSEYVTGVRNVFPRLAVHCPTRFYCHSNEFSIN